MVGDEDGLAVILELFDGIADIPERSMVAGLLWCGKVNPGIPTASQFLDR